MRFILKFLKIYQLFLFDTFCLIFLDLFDTIYPLFSSVFFFFLLLLMYHGDIDGRKHPITDILEANVFSNEHRITSAGSRGAREIIR